MSQLGMNLPGSKRKLGASMNIYTGLLFLAVVCMAAAVALVWSAGVELSPDQGSMAPFSLQDANRIQLHD
jgi:hypothetical protein